MFPNINETNETDKGVNLVIPHSNCFTTMLIMLTNHRLVILNYLSVFQFLWGYLEGNIFKT